MELLGGEIGRPLLESVALSRWNVCGGAVHRCVPWLHQCHRFQAHPAGGKQRTWNLAIAHRYLCTSCSTPGKVRFFRFWQEGLTLTISGTATLDE